MSSYSVRPANADSAAQVASAQRVGVFPGTFDPLTRAHLAVASAALERWCDLVVFCVPERSVDKEDRGRYVDRLGAVSGRIADFDAMVAATTDAGLYVDIAAAMLQLAPAATRSLIAGADKVAQIFDPAYYTEPVEDVVDRLFGSAGLLVAPRAGIALPDDDRLAFLSVSDEHAYTSSSQVRRMQAEGKDVRHLLG